jgi:hypothetical protein
MDGSRSAQRRRNGAARAEAERDGDAYCCGERRSTRTLRRAVVLAGEERAAVHERCIGNDSERFDGAERRGSRCVLRPLYVYLFV